MASLSKTWADGSGDVLTITPDTGNGNGTLQVSSAVCEGLDRNMTVNVATTAGSPDVTAELVISQTGLREVFNASDGSFLLSDGTTFNVLKQ